MKKYLKPIYAGISGTLDDKSNKYKFKVDFDNNTEDDVIKFVEPYFKQSKIDDNIYWFGYSFNDEQANPRRDEFIEFMKHVQIEKLIDPEDEWSGFIEFDDEHITEPDLNSMIHRSLDRIHLNNHSVDTIIYPESNSGNLVKMIVRYISDYIYKARKVQAAELKKGQPSEIEFQYDRFYSDLGDNKIDVPDYVDDEYIYNMLRRARQAPYFSLRKYIKPAVLRNYVTNFYQAGESASVIATSEVILVVDDFGTTGTTIRELIRTIRQINKDCEIYIFTLMGTRKAK